mgnify:CR=1 FL=1
MVWKSREQKLPPPSYFSLIVEHLQRAYRGARISRELMQTLQPFFIEAWRNGKTAEAAAQSTCSCNGREVVPSPVIGIHVARGEVRPPKGAQRGEVFGADELRPPIAVERLERALRQIEQKQRKEESIATRWKQRQQTARKDFVRAEAAQKIGASTQRYAELKAEAERIEQELKRVRSDLRQASRTATSTADTPAPAPVAAEKPRAPRHRSNSASDNAQAAAMLSSIRGLLPDVATQLAAQIKKESGKS